MATMRGALGQPERDQALLAFIKCHLTSMTRWNILRVLSQDPGYRWSVDEVARQAQDLTGRRPRGSWTTPPLPTV